ncbi:hypothetical protein DFJ74DRAFT_657204 [Hyaloraphidium curvatum]|nr:hypothetical protein DFJ74DRAFT_657204 [Hyaloraphidium curvatum]
MPRPVRPLLPIAVAAVLLLVAGAAASPAPAVAPVFRRSCSECEQAYFCEFAFPGAPAGHVACVRYGSSKHLYRRYGPVYTTCATRMCPGVAQPGINFTPDSCAAQCASQLPIMPYATLLTVAPNTCTCALACPVAPPNPDNTVLVVGGGACPVIPA